MTIPVAAAIWAGPWSSRLFGNLLISTARKGSQRLFGDGGPSGAARTASGGLDWQLRKPGGELLELFDAHHGPDFPPERSGISRQKPGGVPRRPQEVGRFEEAGRVPRGKFSRTEIFSKTDPDRKDRGFIYVGFPLEKRFYSVY